MEDSLIIQLNSGLIIEGRQINPFGHRDIDIEIFSEKAKRKLIFAFEEICSIRFDNPPSWTTSDEPATAEEIETITGETFKVSVFTNRKFLKGFIARLEDREESFRTIFFTFSGVRSRNELRPIGEILRKEGAVTGAGLAEALRTQEELRNRRMGEVLVESAHITRESIEKTLEDTPGISENVRVGDILVEAGLVTREQVEKAYASQQAGKKLKVGEILIKQGFITEEQLLSALATKFRLRFIDLKGVIPSAQALGALSEGLATRLQVLPIQLDGRKLTVATASPTDPTVSDNLRFSTKYGIDLVVASARQISEAIDKYYQREEDRIDTLLQTMKGEADKVTIEEEEHEEQISEPDSEVIALINRILIDAYRRGASDIHFEPGAGKSPVQVRYRIDGECLIAHRIAATYKYAINSRIKIISGLDISERRRPQSGKILLRFERNKLEYRVEIMPTVGGQEDIVLRLLSASRPLKLSDMGLVHGNLEMLTGILAKPYGIILCVGPTGSGKTTTLHSALGHINSPVRKIWTVEDPVEITQAGLRQVQVNPKIGFSFPEALRSFLRADPDVIMIGEMRDTETAKIAIEASLTGHLVLSTLHTNSAPETVARLMEMGMDPFNFADALLGIMAQRLAKKLCGHCKTAVHNGRALYNDLISHFLHDAGQASTLLPPYKECTLMTAKGCEKCGGSGYRGRIVIHELMPGSPAVKSAVREKLGVAELRRVALADGMWTLRMDGIMKVMMGMTDMENVFRVCI